MARHADHRRQDPERKISMKKWFLTLFAVLALALVGLNVTSQPAQAQSNKQIIPTAYWGTWKNKSTRVVISARSIKSPAVTLSGKKLGVHVSKHSVSVYQVYKGKQASPSYVIKKAKRHHKTVLRSNFDNIVTKTYTRVHW